MKRQISTFILCVFFSFSLMAQEVVVKSATEDPMVDGVVDAVWANASVNKIDLPFGDETPSLGASGKTTWQALWNQDGIFLLVKVADDIYSPLWAGSDAGAANWMYDKPEIYFDVNEELADGGGANPAIDTNKGHLQISPDPSENNVADGTPVTRDDGVISAFLVTNPTYVVEYFVPFTKLVDKNGAVVNKDLPIGFDVCIIDNDTDGPDDRRRQVWSNDGTKGTVPGESWVSMDGCGTIVLQVTPGIVMAEEIAISSAGGATTIATEAGTLQFTSSILPVDATVQTAKWTVENGTGRATISADGLLTAIIDGTVTVVATTKDGSELEAVMDITISHQFVSMSDIEVIKNGNFDGNATLPAPWSFWTGNSAAEPTVIDGILTCAPVLDVETWQYQLGQSGLTALPDVEYRFSFLAWAGADRDIQVDFEDTPNGKNRYGTDVETSGNADWTFGITTVPTKYTYRVIFDKMVETTIQKVLFLFSSAADVVYLDSISLVSVSDLALLSSPGVSIQKNSVKTVKVYPNPAANELNISLATPDSRITIYNSVGRKIEEVIIQGTQTRLDVSRYAHGLYFVKVNNDAVVKFIK